MKAATLLKFGGELLEQPEHLASLASMLARVAERTRLAVVHGGGREIDAALARIGVPTRQVDGLRVTDQQTMGVVVEVLAGAVNTRFVAAITAAGGRAVGLTGADAGLAVVEKAAPHVCVDGQTVDLGLVGLPIEDGTPALLRDLVAAGYLPVICSIGVGRDGTLFNVNADTLAGHLAGRLRVRRLVIAGATPGVLDGGGHTVARMDRAGAEAMVQSGVASAGMIAKLKASIAALAAGVEEVVLVDGRDAQTLASLLEAPSGDRMSLPGTRMVA
ncbi:MAG: acetylglutamate kinase [Vicinamibacteria bacterium]|nr:acetylglutamate kinase [Vicinamibacteria bacterium]